MIGEIAALGVAPLWAVSSILLKSQTDKLDAMQINATRGLFAAAFAVALVPITGRLGQFSALSASAIGYLLISVVLVFIIGDTIYIKGMGIVGVSKALPMSIIYPIFVLPFSLTITGDSQTVVADRGAFISGPRECSGS